MSIRIKVLSFGRSKKDIFSEEIDRFVKMCRPWASVEFTVLKGVDAGNDSVELALKKEAALLKKHWSSSATIISLGEEGKMIDSYKFAELLSSDISGAKEVIFNIGSAYGLHPDIKKESHMLLSLSKMTMPYKLCRLMFAEQIYRGLAINNNHPYHKE